MSDYTQPNRPALTRLFLVLLPLAAMLAAFVWIASLDPLRSFNNGAPPVEALTVEVAPSTPRLPSPLAPQPTMTFVPLSVPPLVTDTAPSP